nr:MAG TPA: hypothetical protein [Caudoviricetes sp.]DAY15957.1 MAG TPA: hypothetical protein [Caudoviricetes sp.]
MSILISYHLPSPLFFLVLLFFVLRIIIILLLVTLVNTLFRNCCLHIFVFVF